MNVVLFEPEIPQNTGNIIRLCANTGAHLHLVEPLGFSLDQAHVRRASLDYEELAKITMHKSIESVFRISDMNSIYGTLPNGPTTYTAPVYLPDTTVIFGPESVGLPQQIVSRINCANRISIPMMPANRSLNLSNAVSIIVYEIWRQLGFPK
ncbi:uncharacterized protein METZ01_LOCUS112414 [marine metagenome]|jgi:tRNA (cytidine/uridine-2'-O-)-methyltransferase|uniref:tRNA/rRNA methyltransferase SpoU type domain-containing protein n=1 Tax=marine metagenome TaxID=408172 RepID=A0A381X4J7_9ZZZZ